MADMTSSLAVRNKATDFSGVPAWTTDPAAQVTEVAKRYRVSQVTLYKRVGVANPTSATQD